MTLCVMHESGIPLNYSSLPYEGYLGVLRITRITDNGGRYARKSARPATPYPVYGGREFST